MFVNVAEVPTRSTGVYVTTDAGGQYEVTGMVPGVANTWFVRAERTGVLGMVTMTSRNVWQTKVRMRFTMVVDTGDVAGTLAYSGETFGGFTWTAALDRVGLAR